MSKPCGAPVSLNAILRFLDDNATEMLFSVAAVALVYSMARILKARQGVALAFAFAPLVAVWAYQNAMTRSFVLGLF